MEDENVWKAMESALQDARQREAAQAASALAGVEDDYIILGYKNNPQFREYSFMTSSLTRHGKRRRDLRNAFLWDGSLPWKRFEDIVVKICRKG